MNEPPTPSNRAKPADATWLPVIVSIALYPGIGQWMQRRATAGTIYFAFFTLMAALFTWIFFLYLREVIPLIQQALAGMHDPSAAIPPLDTILRPFAVVLFIYVGNVVDVLRGRMQLIRAARHG